MNLAIGSTSTSQHARIDGLGLDVVSIKIENNRDTSVVGLTFETCFKYRDRNTVTGMRPKSVPHPLVLAYGLDGRYPTIEPVVIQKRNSGVNYAYVVLAGYDASGVYIVEWKQGTPPVMEKLRDGVWDCLLTICRDGKSLAKKTFEVTVRNGIAGAPFFEQPAKPWYVSLYRALVFGDFLKTERFKKQKSEPKSDYYPFGKPW
jgi:hypothetical protein